MTLMFGVYNVLVKCIMGLSYQFNARLVKASC